MRFSAIIIVGLLALSRPAAAGEFDLCLKGGLVSHYSDGGMRLPSDYDEQQRLVGGQFYIKSLPLVDAIVGIESSWQTRSYNVAGRPFELKIRDWAVTASIVYPVRIGAATIYSGGGGGSHALAYEYIRPRDLSLVDNGVIIPEIASYAGFHGLIGAKYDLPTIPGGIFVEGRINIIKVPGDDIRSNSISGGIYIRLPG